MSYRRPFIEKPRPASRIAKSQPVGPMTKSAPGVDRKPVLDPATGEPMTWSQVRERETLRKSNGKSKRLQVGTICHFEHQGQIVHGKVLTWGPAGVRAIGHDGEHEVPYQDLNVGAHPDAVLRKSQDDAPIHHVVYSIDDLMPGMHVEFAARGPHGPRTALGQVVSLGAAGAKVAMGERRVFVPYHHVVTAEWAGQ